MQGGCGHDRKGNETRGARVTPCRSIGKSTNRIAATGRQKANGGSCNGYSAIPRDASLRKPPQPGERACKARRSIAIAGSNQSGTMPRFSTPGRSHHIPLTFTTHVRETRNRRLSPMFTLIAPTCSPSLHHRPKGIPRSLFTRLSTEPVFNHLPMRLKDCGVGRPP